MPKVWFTNTDGIPGAEQLWIARGVAVLSGGAPWNTKFDRTAPGDRLVMWANGIGICAVGTVVPGDVVTVTDDRRVNLNEPEEYHLPAEWLDCRDTPMSSQALRDIEGPLPNSPFKSLEGHGPKVLEWFAKRRAVPVPDRDDCDRRAEALLDAGSVPRPNGHAEPGAVPGSSNRYYRCPEVRAWTLQRADGHCELCDRPGFLKRWGRPYLESHHMVPLASRGPDTPENTAAVCANCHREMHHGRDGLKLTQELQRRIAEKEAPYVADPTLGRVLARKAPK